MTEGPAASQRARGDGASISVSRFLMYIERASRRGPPEEERRSESRPPHARRLPSPPLKVCSEVIAKGNVRSADDDRMQQGMYNKYIQSNGSNYWERSKGKTGE